MEIKSCNLRISSQYPYCNYPLSMDLYTGCPHKCAYCFARQQSMLNASCDVSCQEDYDRATVRGYNEVINMLADPNHYKGSKQVVQYYIKRKQPFHIGGMADPFPRGVEEKLGHAKMFIEAVNKFKYPCIWSTKNPIPEYGKLMGQGNHIIQCTIIGFGEVFRKIESGVLPGEDRIEILKKYYKGNAKKIVIRMQPCIPQLYTDKKLEDYVKKIAEVADAVTVEFLKMDSGEKFTEMSEAMKFDLRGQYKKINLLDGKDYLLPNKLRHDFMIKLRGLAHKYGLEFYAAENQYRDLGDGPNCCGINQDKDGIFASKALCNTTNLLYLAKEKGNITIEDLDKVMPDIYKTTFKSDLGVNAGGRKTTQEQKHMTIEEDYKNIWKTNHRNNPSIMFKHLKPYRDKNGKVAFKYTYKED